MNRLQQAWVWLRRIGHCRGFGIQSPTDYRFVRYVVNEHWPYYAYRQLGINDSPLRRKLGQLYFRLANFLQPATVVDLLGYDEYLRAGCRKAVVTHQPFTASPSSSAASPSPLILAPASADIGILLDSCGKESVLVIEDIGHSPEAWHAVCSDQRTSVTFDLYYCGIAFFDTQRSKQQHIVNF